jgi:hypothetical protein
MVIADHPVVDRVAGSGGRLGRASQSGPSLLGQVGGQSSTTSKSRSMARNRPEGRRRGRVDRARSRLPRPLHDSGKRTIARDESRSVGGRGRRTPGTTGIPMFSPRRPHAEDQRRGTSVADSGGSSSGSPGRAGKEGSSDRGRGGRLLTGPEMGRGAIAGSRSRWEVGDDGASGSPPQGIEPTQGKGSASIRGSGSVAVGRVGPAGCSRGDFGGQQQLGPQVVPQQQVCPR